MDKSGEADGNSLLQDENKPDMGLPPPSDSPKHAPSESLSIEIQEKNPESMREKWARNFDFLLACIGFSVGLGNMWRFPYLCYKNGGGVFLIPYFICVFLSGIPIFFLECTLGQFMAQGSIGTWKICPLFRGLGIASMFTNFIQRVYYNVILAWAFHFLFSSFTFKLPWASCDNDWNTGSCSFRNKTVDISDSDSTNETAYNATLSDNNSTSNISASESDVKVTDPATEYWQYRVLQLSSGIDEVGSMQWELALCLLLAWIVVYFCICNGIKSSGKVMYVTATTPYLVLLALLIRGVTLPGSAEGIVYYLKPKWEKLLEPEVWTDAGTQIIYSCSIGIGTLMALGSYNDFHHNSWRDCLAYTFVNSGTSILCGFVIFSVLGFMAHEMGVSIDDVAESGPGLAFIAYPKAVAQMPHAPIWSVIFFIAVILLGMDSQFGNMEGFITSTTDLFPVFLRRGIRRQIFIIASCIVAFLIGLTMVTQGGVYVFLLFDFYSGGRIQQVICFVECIAIAYIYGIQRYYDNLETMLGFKVTGFMKLCWLILSPAVTLLIFILCIMTAKELTYNETYHYPTWAVWFGYTMPTCAYSFIVLTAVFTLLSARGTFWQRLKCSVRPRLLPHQLRPQDSLADLCKETPQNTATSL